ncbi:hypothetical protein ASG51_22455 [Methylobacterium sp. Leaf465]|uniref:hypothetical protein n=1 Tax=Methylobacterium sp. Leaf465 TaxID=1736385 RepID=UPI0007021CFD|nr:hypothetical protein [Methylobacterium sp. Leaf465]KQT77450.1 hypothetical protein ASG51_22455 [Methylobacterium sp. Leaf465]
MSLLGKWRIVELLGNEDDHTDTVEPAYILFENGRGEFDFWCVTGAFAGGARHGSDRAAITVGSSGNDEKTRLRLWIS